MRTVSLRRRVVAIGVTVVVVVFAAVDVFVWLNVRDYLVSNLHRVLESRAELAVAFAPTIDPTELARLAGSEVFVSVRDAGGREIERGGQANEGGSQQLDAPPSGSGGFTRQVRLPNGDTIVLIASTRGMDQTLRRVAVSEMLGTILGLGMAFALLTRAARVALRPIDTVVVTARQIKSGRTGERLRPDHTDTELGRMAVAFDEMLDALEAAVVEARASEEAERRFLGEAAHQLRTPLAGIQASVEALSAARTEAERDELLAIVAKETARAGRRVAALLRIARLDRGAGPVRSRCDVVALCREEAERSARLAPGLDVRVHSEEPCMLAKVDLEALREALTNLLDNACRHARSWIVVTVSMSQRRLEVQVDDDGPGVPAGDADRVFERFVSLDGQGGAGLGLSIVRAIARNQGGEAAYADGAFIIRLSQPEPSASPAPPGTPEPMGRRGLTRSPDLNAADIGCDERSSGNLVPNGPSYRPARRERSN